MSILINILICFFVLLLICQLFLGPMSLIEGLDTQYKDYDKNDPNNAMILAQQNAGNIEYLKQRIDEVHGLYQEVQDMSGNLVGLQQQVNGLVQAQQDYANQMTGGSPPEITGAIDEDGENMQNNNLITE